MLFTASASILLTVYDLQINKTPWLDIEVPSGAPGILKGALSVALIYTFLIFLLHAWTDLHRWFLARSFIRIDGYNSLIIKIDKHMSGIYTTILITGNNPAGDGYDEEQKQKANQLLSEGLSILHSHGLELASLKRSQKSLTTAHWFRISVLDIGGPIVLGLFALVKIGPAFLPFVSAIFC